MDILVCEYITDTYISIQLFDFRLLLVYASESSQGNQLPGCSYKLRPSIGKVIVSCVSVCAVYTHRCIYIYVYTNIHIYIYIYVYHLRGFPRSEGPPAGALANFFTVCCWCS